MARKNNIRALSFFATTTLLYIVTIENCNAATTYCSHPPLIDNAECAVVDCNSPVRVIHMVNSGNLQFLAASIFQSGTCLRYTCDDGYEIEGGDLVTCQSTGRWDNLPRCVKTIPLPQCTNVPRIANGLCQPTARMKTTIFYQQTSKQTQPTTTEQPTAIPDTEFPTNTNGFPTVEWYDDDLYDDYYYYQSLASQGIAGNNQRRNARRQKLSTSTRQSLLLANRQTTRIPEPAIQNAECRCDANYDLEGPSQISCLGQDLWSSLPTCRRRPGPVVSVRLSCGALPTVPGANCVQTIGTAKRDYEPGDYFNCNCMDGYYLESQSPFLGCKATGEWTDTPVCLPVPTQSKRCFCVPIEVPNSHCFEIDDNGVVGSRVLNQQVFGIAASDLYIQAGKRVTYTCEDGYELEGNDVVECQSLSANVCHWTAHPECKPKVCTGSPLIANGICVKDAADGSNDIYQIGQETWCSCDPGFDMEGIPLASCLSRENWSNLPKCIPRRSTTPPPTCRAPPPVDGATCECPIDNPDQPIEFNVGDTISYKCMDGFRMVGNASVTCQRNKQWTQSPVCAPVIHHRTTCPPPNKIPNAYCPCDNDNGGNSPSRFQIGDKVVFTCNTGYRFVQRFGDSVTCQTDGTWTTYPRCRRDRSTG